MPTYDYRCEKCGAEFSLTETMSAHGKKAVTCPTCKSANVTQLITASYVKAVRKS